MGWSQERLEHVAQTRLSGAKLIVVANREPYIHRYRNGEIEWIRPAGGLTTALDPVMQACGGIWVAHGSGDADVESSDAQGRLGVPPDHPNYTLRRVWLTRQQEEGYYFGFSNSTIWPMCHQVYERPTFSLEHWQSYCEVNQLFADAVLEEANGEPAIVFVQDYHFALLPKLLKAARPDLVIAHFWHIPWPNPETFGICPWAKEILEGMLSNDFMSFHTQYHCNNFLETVDRSIECRIDRERFAVERNARQTIVRPYPISVDPRLGTSFLGDDWEERAKQLRERFALADRPLLVGVDRVDYTKGIPERLRAVDHYMEHFPEWKGKFHFLQVGAPSRTQLSAYSDLNAEVEQLVQQINQKHGDDQWQPIIFWNDHIGPKDIFLLYRMANACVVSALHDGMNLVAKEFVSARPDEQGVLVLSQFTGAARELPDALLINPFDVHQTALALQQALTMPADEQRRRMRKMRQQVEDNNIFRWAGMLLSEACKLVEPLPETEVTTKQPPADELSKKELDQMIISHSLMDVLHVCMGGV